MSSLIDQILNIEVDDVDVSAILGSLECKLKGDNVSQPSENSFTNVAYDPSLNKPIDKNIIQVQNDSKDKKIHMVDLNNKLHNNDNNVGIINSTVTNQANFDQKNFNTNNVVLQKPTNMSFQDSLRSFGDSLKDYYRIACKTSQECGDKFLLLLGNLIDGKIGEAEFIENFVFLRNSQILANFKKMMPELIRALKSSGKSNISKLFIDSLNNSMINLKNTAYKPLVNSNNLSVNAPINKDNLQRSMNMNVNHRLINNNMVPINSNLSNQTLRMMSQNNNTNPSNINNNWNVGDQTGGPKSIVQNTATHAQILQNPSFNKFVSIAPSTNMSNIPIRQKLSDTPTRMMKNNATIRTDLLQNTSMGNQTPSNKIQNSVLLPNQISEASANLPRHSYRLRPNQLESITKPHRPENINSLGDSDLINHSIKQEKSLNLNTDVNNYLAITKSNSNTLINSEIIRQKLIAQLNKMNFTLEINHLVPQLLSRSLEWIIKNLLNSAILNAYHRTDVVKNDFYDYTNDIKSQLAIIDDVDNNDRMKKDLLKREALLKAAKTKCKNESIEQIRLKEHVKQMQQVEEDYLQKQATNSAALAAIGNKKKRKIETNNLAPTDKQFSSDINSINYQNSNSIDDQNTQFKTVTRITLKDLQYALENHAHFMNNKLLIKSYHK